MFYADQPDPKGNEWWVTKVDADQNIISQQKIAMKMGATAEDAIAAVQQLSQVPTERAREALANQQREAAIKAECERRILSVLDLYTVANIQGAYLAAELTQTQIAVFKAGRAWVAAMQATCRNLIADPDGSDPVQDLVWPGVPEGVAELAAQY